MKYWLAALAVIAIAVAIVYPRVRPKPQVVGYCGDCHEMGDSSAAWLGSAHRDVACSDCHGGMLQPGNARRLDQHARGADLGTDPLPPMVGRGGRGGAVRQLSSAGTRHLARGPARHDVRPGVHRQGAQPQAHSDGGLLPLPWDALSGRVARDGHARRYQGAVAAGGCAVGGPRGHSVPGVPPDAPAWATGRTARAAPGYRRQPAADVLAIAGAVRPARAGPHRAGIAAAAGDARRHAAREDEPRSTPGALLPMPRRQRPRCRRATATTAHPSASTKASVAWPAIRATASRRALPAPTAIPRCPTADWTWRRWIPPSARAPAATTSTSSSASIATRTACRRSAVRWLRDRV
jgi:hypothetical protein